MASQLEAYADLGGRTYRDAGGGARGTTRTAAMQSRLPEYPDALLHGHVHVGALAEHLAHDAMAMRGGITLVEDADSAALYTDLSRGVDKRLWVLEAHLNR